MALIAQNYVRLSKGLRFEVKVEGSLKLLLVRDNKNSGKKITSLTVLRWSFEKGVR